MGTAVGPPCPRCGHEAHDWQPFIDPEKGVLVADEMKCRECGHEFLVWKE